MLGAWEQITAYVPSTQELEDIPKKIAFLQPMTIHALKKWIGYIDTKYSWSIDTHLLLFVLVGGGVLMTIAAALAVWHYKNLATHMGGVQPVVKMFKKVATSDSG